MFKKKSILIMIIAAMFILFSVNVATAQDFEFTSSWELGFGLQIGTLLGGAPQGSETDKTFNAFGIDIVSWPDWDMYMDWAIELYEGDPDTGLGAVTGLGSLTFNTGFGADLYPYSFSIYINFADLYGEGMDLSFGYVPSYGKTYVLNYFNLGDMALQIQYRNYLNSDVGFDYSTGGIAIGSGSVGLSYHEIAIYLDATFSPIDIFTGIRFFSTNNTGFAPQDWFGLPTQELIFYLEPDFVLDGVGTLSLDFSLYLDFFTSYTEIMIAFEAGIDQIVENLAIDFYFEVEMDSQPATTVGFTPADTDTEDGIDMEEITVDIEEEFHIPRFIIDFAVSYALDMDGMSVEPFLHLAANLYPLADAEWAERSGPWMLSLGANLALGPEQLMNVPIIISITNLDNYWFLPLYGQSVYWDAYGESAAGYPGYEQYFRSTKLWFTVGLEFYF